MSSFDYVKAASLSTLLEELWLVKWDGALLAGGTDLLVKIRAGLAHPKVLFDINHLPELSGIGQQGNEVHLGSATHIASIAASSLLRDCIPLLPMAASHLGSPQIRNRATLGGNIMSGSPAADTVTPLIAMGAQIKLRGREGERRVPLEDFVKGPGQTDIQVGEVLLGVVVPLLKEECRSQFLKIGRRKAMAISVVNLAGWLRKTKGDMIEDLRIVLGAVAPTAIRAKKTEAFLRGKQCTIQVIKEAARLAAEEVSPISDIRGTEDGRRALVEAWTFRLLEILSN
jgi:CO/xanthine dehydrogenase FAD-binding subunit